VLDKRVIGTGYNGVPENMTNCDQGGCERCANRERFASGTGYDVCICVHAEQNALITAARFGNAVDGATVYSTMQPCFGCTKELLQANIRAVKYLHGWSYPDTSLAAQYKLIQGRFPEGITQIRLADPDEGWAHPSRSSAPRDTGHSVPQA
jgi:dCMP deaminase